MEHNLLITLLGKANLHLDEEICDVSLVEHARLSYLVSILVQIDHDACLEQITSGFVEILGHKRRVSRMVAFADPTTKASPPMAFYRHGFSPSHHASACLSSVLHMLLETYRLKDPLTICLLNHINKLDLKSEEYDPLRWLFLL